VEPEAALRRANAKFQTRFDAMELHARDQGRMLRDLTLQELEYLWGAVKHEDTKGTKDTTIGSTN
jgi:nucleoside triphosphate diphosphatase